MLASSVNKRSIKRPAVHPIAWLVFLLSLSSCVSPDEEGELEACYAELNACRIEVRILSPDPLKYAPPRPRR